MFRFLLTLLLIGAVFSSWATDPIDSLTTIISTPVHDSIKAQTLNRLAGLYRGRGVYAKADSVATAALEIALKLSSSKLEAEAHINLYTSQLKQGNFLQVLAQRAELEKVVERANDQRLWGNFLTLMANCQLRAGQLPTALNLFLEAHGHFQKANDRKGMSSCLNNIAIVHAKQNRTEQALSYFAEATAIDRSLNDGPGVISGIRNQSICLLQLKRYDDARPKLDSALALCRQTNNLKQEAAILDVLGNLMYFKKEYLAAEDFFEQEYAIIKDRPNPMEKAGNRINLGAVKLEQGQFAKAESLIREGLQLSLATGHKEYIRDGYEKLARVDSALNRMDAAYEHYKLFSLYKDSLLNEKTTTQLTEMETRFDTERKEQQIVLLNKDNELQQQEIRRQKLIRNGFVGGFIIVLLSALIFLIQRNRINREKQRSEDLLLNILPYETAQELKQKGTADAKLMDQVTVLFTDFKGFTALAEQLSPQQLVAEINECFSEFDRICERHGIEKIKTIGDAYMAAGGLPLANATHAFDVVNAALEMCTFIEKGKMERIAQGLPYFEVRIGVHTGPVVAGIVGIKKFQYDIWGDTVNTASRMESSGEVGKINISQTTCELVKERFSCEYRGEVEAKGKGKVKMYFIEKFS